jgi:glucosylceramidase
MKSTLASFLLLPFCFPLHVSAQQKTAEAWLTDPGNNIFFQKQSSLSFSQRPEGGSTPFIAVDDKRTFQSIDGFGFALTGGSAMNMMKMSAAARSALIRELFATDKNNIGTSYLRLSIGASDLNETVFSYDDLPGGQTDTALIHFDLGPDKKDVIPVLKEILKINPSIKIMASPWSPPVWMKNNHDTKGGNLLKEYYPVYAKYFVRYIQEMKKQGIRIDAITVQNEPLHPGNNPSLQMFAPDMAEFVRDHLGPAFARSKLNTKIIIYDHNADKPDYPIAILNDPAAKKYIDGSAFHLYGGKIEALSEVHDAHPDKNLYFTEQWVGAPGNFKRDIADHISKLIVGATRNWCKTVIEWNLASDPQYRPHTDRGGCTSCLGAVTIGGDSIKRNPAYYIIAHAAKFARPGSVRIESSEENVLSNTAFKTPSGKIVLIVLNSSNAIKRFDIVFNNKIAKAELAAGAVATYTW